LKVWLDASQLALSNGAAVSSWTDMSGNANHGALKVRLRRFMFHHKRQ
jgi:hypothetical protein